MLYHVTNKLETNDDNNNNEKGKTSLSDESIIVENGIEFYIIDYPLALSSERSASPVTRRKDLKTKVNSREYIVASEELFGNTTSGVAAKHPAYQRSSVRKSPSTSPSSQNILRMRHSPTVKHNNNKNNNGDDND